MGQQSGQPPYQPPPNRQPPGPPQGYPPPPPQGGYPPQHYQQPMPQTPPKKRRGFFKWIAIGIGGLILIGIIASVAGGGGNKNATATPGAASTAVASNPTAAVTQSVASTAAPTAAASATRTAAPATAATATSPARAKVGEKVAVQGMSVTVSEVRDPAPPTSISKPKDGNRFVAVDLTIENTDTKPASYNALYATVKDTEGRHYDTTFTDVASPALSAGNNSPSDKIRGWVVFEVPITAKLATFKYEPLGGKQVVVDIAK